MRVGGDLTRIVVASLVTRWRQIRISKARPDRADHMCDQPGAPNIAKAFRREGSITYWDRSSFFPSPVGYWRGSDGSSTSAKRYASSSTIDGRPRRSISICRSCWRSRRSRDAIAPGRGDLRVDCIAAGALRSRLRGTMAVLRRLSITLGFHRSTLATHWSAAAVK